MNIFKRIIATFAMVMFLICWLYVGIPFFSAIAIHYNYESNPAISRVVCAKIYKNLVFELDNWVYYLDYDSKMKVGTITRIKPDGRKKEILTKNLCKPNTYIGRMVTDGKWIYYTLHKRITGRDIALPYKEEIEPFGLWKIRIDGKENQLLNEDITFYPIKLQDNKIYTVSKTNDAVYAIDTNGKIIKKIVSINEDFEKISKVEVRKGFVYYDRHPPKSSMDNLYRVSVSNNETTKIIENIIDYDIIEENIYYSTGIKKNYSDDMYNFEIFRTNLDGTGQKKIYSENCFTKNIPVYMLVYFDNSLYLMITPPCTEFVPQFKINFKFPVPMPVLPDDKLFKFQSK